MKELAGLSVACATVVMLCGVDGWGWLVVVALFAVIAS